MLRSSLCKQSQLESPAFQHWAVLLREQRMLMHRKIWEYCYIAQALDERGMLAPGRVGLGFAVGREPLPSLFASMGCSVLATDLSQLDPDASAWLLTDQHADSLSALNARGICDPSDFVERVSFRYLDMRNLPDGLGRFDFVWSACSAEHLGSIKLGAKFLLESLKYLKPGGVAVHTVEYNVKSRWATLSQGPTVLFRKRDLRRLGAVIRRSGYAIDLDFSEGHLPADRFVDRLPFPQEVHLRLELSGYIVSSFGLIVESPMSVSWPSEKL